MKTRMIRVDPRKLKLLERNAHFMRHEVFQQLVANVKKDGDLTSVPFAVQVYTADGKPATHEDGAPVYEVRSGNHRVKAAIAAGLSEIDVKVTEEQLPNDHLVAIQLSHNAIFGEDDPALLKELYQEIQDVDWRIYSGLDDRTLELLSEVDVSSLSEANLQFQTLTFAFLPDEVEVVKAVWEQVKVLATGDEVWLMRWRDYDRFLDTMEEAGASHNVKNAATTLMILLNIVSRHLHEFAEGWYEDGELLHNGYVPLSSVLGTSKVPAKVAARLKKLVDSMVSRGEVEQRWQGLEKLLSEVK